MSALRLGLGSVLVSGALVCFEMSPALALPSGRVEGTRVLFRERAPRPARVWEQDSPCRVVLDFPGKPLKGYGAFPKTEPLDLPGVIAVRYGQSVAEDGAHSRLTVVLVRRAPYTVSWKSGVLTLAVAPEELNPRPSKDAPAVGPAVVALEAVDPGVVTSDEAPRARPAPRTPPERKAGGVRAGSARPASPLNPCEALLNAGDLEGASAALAVSSGADDTDRRARLLARLAIQELRGSRPDALVDGHAREAIELGQEFVGLDVCLGRSLDRLGRREEAARWYRRATQLPAAPGGPAPEQCAAHFLWADALYRCGQNAEALAAYAEALSSCPVAPECSWALYQSAKLERRAGREPAARARVAELITAHPGDYWTARARELFAAPAEVAAR